MPRSLRIGFEGAMDPVMNREDRWRPIVRDDQDRQRLLETPPIQQLPVSWRIKASWT
jgi:hypothetical protein